MGSGALVGKLTTPLPRQHMPESKCIVNIITCVAGIFQELYDYLKGRCDYERK
jgi:hypothetical protein